MRRTIDLIVAVIALVILSPLVLIISCLIRASMSSPIFFIQERAGKNGRPFNMYKFRSMNIAYDSLGNALSDSERLTTLGKFLRRTSIDELPGLINVVRGEMSLIGPRPLLVSYVNRYNSHHSRRLEVKPGITGWAQVNGRQDIPFSKRFELDVWYIDNRNALLDLKILALTLLKVLRREGVRPGQDVVEVDDLNLSTIKKNNEV